MKGTVAFLMVFLGTTLPGQSADAALPDLASLEDCRDSLDLAIFNSPRRAHRKAPLRVLITSETELKSVDIAALTPDGELIRLEAKRYGGPPYGWVATIDKPAVGTWRVGIGDGARVDACQRIRVRRSGRVKNTVAEGEVVDPIWRSRIKWERDTENLFSLWIEALFDAPLNEDVSWNPFHLVTRDSTRNLLFNHLGMHEDRGGKKGIRMKPDCADFPYFLRGYFAWKMGLPFGYRGCRRGNAKRAPRCGDMMTNQQASELTTHTEAFEYFIRRKVGGTVHSSSPRTVPKDEASDFYPVKLTRKSLRPGAMYADPYGHTLLVGKWIAGTSDKAGTLLAVDAQPDGTIGRRVFWKGSFLFPEDDAIKGAGFKRFRPVRKGREGNVALTNAEISKSIDYGDFSTEQWDRGKEAFYERMDEVITPQALAPKAAFMAYIDALDQQIRRRVESVENGEDWKRKHRGRTMTMPEGPAIFITSGAWESYSTPSRDLRLLIAMDTVRNFPNRLKTRPKRFTLPPGMSVDAAYRSLQELLASESGKRTFTYKKSDGSSFTLSMADVMNREEAFQMAYNPNDCIEIRWGAATGSEEASSCRRRAPDEHKARMDSYRMWFKKRVRPLN
jgi:hypothetical protein